MTNIIVIEDNNTMRLGITESLTREGFRVNEYSNGPDAIEFLKSHSVELAIVDLKMEPMDGLEVLSIIKSDFKNIDVLLISAYANVQTAVEAIKNGASDFLTKPFSPEELRIRVRKILDAKQKQEKITELIEQNEYLSDELLSFRNDLIGNSTPFVKMVSLVNRIATKES